MMAGRAGGRSAEVTGRCRPFDGRAAAPGRAKARFGAHRPRSSRDRAAAIAQIIASLPLEGPRTDPRMPTITTLIPAYKKEFLGETLLGLARQTFRDFRVVISDDSPDDEITHLIQAGHFGDLSRSLDLEVVRGPKNARLNHQALIDRWAGSSPFVHLQLDDDVVFPEFYRTHMAAHQTGRYSVSVSRRWVTHGDTRPVMGINQPAVVARSPLHFVPLDEEAVFQTMVPTCNNWIGEFTQMVMSAEGARAYPRPPVDDLSYYGWLDVGFVLTAVQKAPLVIVRDHLGIFRQHASQTTHQMKSSIGRVSSMAWVTTALLAWREGRISRSDVVTAITWNVRECLQRFGEDDPVINEFFDMIQAHGGHLERLYAAYKPFWLRVLASHPATSPMPVQAREPALA
jgi:glycosyltransferase involved in cell wall biosynthesis